MKQRGIALCPLEVVPIWQAALMRHPDIDLRALQLLLGIAVQGLGLAGVSMARTNASSPPARIPPPPGFALEVDPEQGRFLLSGLVDFGLTAALRSNGQFAMIDPVVEMQRDLAIYRAQGLDEAFVARLGDLPQVPMWYRSHAELQAAGMLTQP